jgi:hypothetical protein
MTESPMAVTLWPSGRAGAGEDDGAAEGDGAGEGGGVGEDAAVVVGAGAAGLAALGLGTLPLWGPEAIWEPVEMTLRDVPCGGLAVARWKA